MRCFRSFAAAAVIFTNASVVAQSSPQIHVLQMPAGMRTLPVQRAEGMLSVHYSGHLNASRTIWVRVFRDSFEDLKVRYPSETAPGKCVVYAHASRFRVDHAFDQELRINDLISFFQAAAFQERQTLTLVFEEGDDPGSNGPLRLEKGSVLAYFENAIEMPLIAPDDMKELCSREAQKQIDSRRPEKVGLLAGLFKPQKVLAAESPAPLPSPASLPANAFLPPCQKVRLIPLAPVLNNASLKEDALEALEPAGVRESGGCGE